MITRNNEFDGLKNNLHTSDIDGFKITPKNRYKYDVKVNSMLVVNQEYIEKLLRKKNKRKLDYFLRYIIALIEGSEDAGSISNLRLALDDIAHYRSIVEYKYRKYLDEKYTNLLLQKIDMLEHEIKVKLANQKFYEVKEEKESHRTR